MHNSDFWDIPYIPGETLPSYSLREDYLPATECEPSVDTDQRQLTNDFESKDLYSVYSIGEDFHSARDHDLFPTF
ncbi:hypothetical protein [Flavilitoribacter nigricans]|uniref:Uncharacterized protein n=1 Tax=Flavilitoribacter nigricans (strain ATCC 23147 / DSM 23189 / NBRC 102662 / NCIMB 1420 / SS-2) TaxID=1122177 RepID=A0A2D0N6R6_FLAN2|nr:hypothetical protein [Flavilitoribacter nigricans]PHN04076.1 hypothetical protein CRP01_23040 [Flavilitoribacter nigricans DSM 23189 = NBRC 102662]